MVEDINTRTRQYYDRLMSERGEKYLADRWQSEPVKRSHYAQTRRTIETFFSRVAGRPRRLLEIGCGPGTWSKICRANADEVTLLDISEEMLRIARSRLGDNGFSYVCSDLLADGVKPTGDYHAVFSARALEYMRDKREAIRRIAGFLCSGGVAAVITKNPAWGDKVADTLAGRMDEDRIQTDWIGWEQLAEYFRDAGFKDVAVWPAAIGSYRGLHRTRISAAWANLRHTLMNGRPMRIGWDAPTESYIITGKLA
jgi:SAM-dependent methyltransferase